VTDLTLKQNPGPPAQRAYAVLVTDGPSKGKRLILEPEQRAFVGKSATCDLVLADPEVSRRHLSLEATPRGLRVTDLESTNGTFVGQLRIIQALVTSAQSVRLGQSGLSFVDAPAETTPGDAGFRRMLGESVVMRRLFARARRAAASLEPLLIEGETGTGKDLLAECIHDEGPRAAGPFVVAPNEDHDWPALFALGRGGTLVLDAIDALSFSAQATLLAALDADESRAPSERARVVATTRIDLDGAVERGSFSDDLLLRLAVLRLTLPPLRERPGDALVLARHFRAAMGGIDPATPLEPELARVVGEALPGNVRELETVIARHLARGAGTESSAADFIDGVVAKNLPMVEARERVVAEFERRYLDHVLAASGGHVGKAAAAAGIARRYFQVLRSRTR
jgi:DNA-binding NtrC family response regulator